MKIAFARTLIPVAPWIADQTAVAIRRPVRETQPIILQLRVAQYSPVSRKSFRQSLWQPAPGC